MVRNTVITGFPPLPWQPGDVTAYSTPTRPRNPYLPLQPRKNPDAERNASQTTPKSNTATNVRHAHTKPAVIFSRDGLENITVEKILANRTKRLAHESEVNFRLSQNPLDENIPGSTVSTESEPLVETAVTVAATIAGVTQQMAAGSTVTLDPSSASV